MVRGAGKTEDGLVRYNEKVNKLGDDLRELYETIRVNVDEEEQWKVFDFVEDFFMEELEIVKERIEGGANEKAVLRLFINCPFVCINFDFFWLYRKFLKSSEIVYNRLEIKNDIAKERRGLRHDVVYKVFCFGLG